MVLPSHARKMPESLGNSEAEPVHNRVKGARMNAMTAQPKKETTPAVRAVLGVVGLVQAAFAFLAFWDLAHRNKTDVRGPKPVWIPVILVNWIGPASYFLFGIKR